MPARCHPESDKSRRLQRPHRAARDHAGPAVFPYREPPSGTALIDVPVAEFPALLIFDASFLKVPPTSLRWVLVCSEREDTQREVTRKRSVPAKQHRAACGKDKRLCFRFCLFNGVPIARKHTACFVPTSQPKRSVKMSAVTTRANREGSAANPEKAGNVAAPWTKLRALLGAGTHQP